MRVVAVVAAAAVVVAAVNEAVAVVKAGVAKVAEAKVAAAVRVVGLSVSGGGGEHINGVAVTVASLSVGSGVGSGQLTSSLDLSAATNDDGCMWIERWQYWCWRWLLCQWLCGLGWRGGS